MSAPDPQPLDLSGPIRLAVLGNALITPFLGVWNLEPAVFTRKPVPSDATYPLVAISPDISIGNADYLDSRIPLVRRDIGVYGRQPDDYRLVEGLGYLLRAQFHRQRFSIDLSPNYAIVEIVADGPMSAPTDDDMLVGRAVLLRLKLKDLTTS